VGKGDHAALDYKMKFISENKIEKIVIASRLSFNQTREIGNKFKYIPASTYFADEKPISNLFDVSGEGKNKIIKLKKNYKDLMMELPKLGVKSLVPIKGFISSTNEDLIKLIKDHLKDFFIYENFGCRQNKGFGCFSINSINDKSLVYNIEELLKNSYDSVFKYNGETGDIFSIVSSQYKLLKSGHDRNSTYAKSKLFIYFANRNIRWEKRWMKRQFELNKDSLDLNYFLKTKNVPPRNTNSEPVDIDFRNRTSDNLHPNNNNISYRYVRALLGLAEQYEFQTNSRYGEKIVFKIGNDICEIKRFKSPIVFKIIDDSIYLCVEKLSARICKEFLDKEIPVSIRVKRRNDLLNTPNHNIIPSLKIPKSFNVEEFIENAIKSIQDKKFDFKKL
jgi:hypothetical protein